MFVQQPIQVNVIETQIECLFNSESRLTLKRPQLRIIDFVAVDCLTESQHCGKICAVINNHGNTTPRFALA